MAPSSHSHISPTPTLVGRDAESRTSSVTLTQPSRFITLFVAHVGAALALFLATTDATIVSTSLPTIAGELEASQNYYSWVGVAYMLTQTAFQPLYPLFSRLAGRKAVLFSSIFIFILGSALCGAAQTIVWLIVTRGIQGIGAGGIVNSVWVLTSDIVAPEEKNKWSQALSLTWSASAIAGPILGGAFSSGMSGIFTWRWAFYMNIPIGLLAICLMHWSLRYFELERTAVRLSFPALCDEFNNNFDFVGVMLLVIGTVCVVLGFSVASQEEWSSPAAISLLVLGPLLLTGGVCYETQTTRVAILPATLYKSRTEVIILFVSFFHNVAFNAGTFYLALYYQAELGVSPLFCGILMLPYSLGSALASMPIALFNNYWSKKTKNTSCYKYVIVGGLALSTIGFGLLTLLNERSSMASREIYPLVAGIGIGMLFHAPFAALTNGMSSDERSRATSAFFLLRFIGATSGLSISGAIFMRRIAYVLPENAASAISMPEVDWRQVAHLKPVELRTSVLHAVSESTSAIWILCVGCLGFACLISLGIRIVAVEKSALEEGSKEKAEIGGV